MAGRHMGGIGTPISGISLEPHTCQADQENKFNIPKAKSAWPGETLAKGSLALYNSKFLETTSDELVAIWLKLGTYSSVYKEVTQQITSSNSIAGDV